MSERVGAPGTGLTRRELLAASGGLGVAAVAGCTAPSNPGEVDGGPTRSATAAPEAELPTTGRPEVVRLHLANSGYMSHPLHTHDHRFRLVEKDGGRIPEAAQYEQDSTNVAPADRHTIEFEADADPGIYLLHCHKVDHAMNGNSYPGGMVTGIVYKEAMDTGVFVGLMEYAGYEG